MPRQTLIGAVALAMVLPLTDAQAFDESKYPDWSGAYRRIPVPGVTGQPGYDQTKRLGKPQQAPLTPEAKAIMDASMADQAKGGQGNYPTYTCLSPGMPRIMTLYGMAEFIITPETTHVLLEHIHDSRRIYTDGRDWPHDDHADLPGLFHRQVDRYQRRWPLRRARSRDPRVQGTPRLRRQRHAAAPGQSIDRQGAHLHSTRPIRTSSSTSSRPSTIR